MGQRSQRFKVLRRSYAIFAFGTFACAGLFAQAQIAVPGMSRFTEAGFGFSFWYPAAWKVTGEPVPNPPSNGWFRDATIVRVLQIRNPEAALDQEQPPGVILRELLAPGGLTELGTESASPVGVDQKYYFDSGTRQWMYTRLSEAPDGAPPATHPAKLLQRTMGGLPVFWGAERHGAEVIVPVDRSHFLAMSTMDAGGDDIHIYLAATIVATRPDEGEQASGQMQFNTIRAEGVKLGAIGKALEPLGFWYKDSQHVYNFDGEVLREADPESFVPLSRSSPGDNFATDGARVYRAYSGGAIPGADPKTFVATGQFTARDAQHTYDWTSGKVKIGNVTAPQ
jgi:DKNYY family